jgi:hypothetical protein
VASTHPIDSCTEQASGNVYSKAVSQAGLVVLAFNASFQGVSNLPRFVENSEFRVSNFRYEVDYFQSQTLPDVDPGCIGMLGICSGGDSTVKATITMKYLPATVAEAKKAATDVDITEATE